MMKEEVRFKIFEYLLSEFKPKKLSDFEVVGAVSAKLSYAVLSGNRPDFSDFKGD